MFPSVLDSSALAAFKQCPQLFKKGTIDSWKPRDQSVHLHAGGAFAKGIEVARNAFYSGLLDTGTWHEEIDESTGNTKKHLRWVETPCQPGNAEDSVAAGLAALLASYGDYQEPADSAKSADRMAGALEFYFSNYPLNEEEFTPILLPSGKRGIEFSFAEPLPILHPETGDPLIYCGRMDAIVNFAGGQYIMDEKTTTQLGASWGRQFDLRSQFTGYAWGCGRAGIKIDGVIVRGVSILKTKYDTQQPVSYRPEWQVDRWYEELLDWVDDMIRAYKTGKWRHNLDHACGDFGGCGFKQVCMTAPAEQHKWLETYYEQRAWDPITRKETKL
jgi:hypothetical protein